MGILHISAPFMKIIVSVITKRIRQQRKRSFYVQADRKGRAAAPSALTLWRGVKNGYFTARLTEKGGGVSPVSPDRKGDLPIIKMEI